MAAVLSVARMATLPGLKQVAYFNSKDTVEYDGEVFVRLAAYNQSLKALICESNECLPSTLPPKFSLSSSVGLNQLQELRNRAQAESLIAEEGRCSLFDDEETDERSSAKRKRFTKTTREEINAKRREHAALEVELEYGGEVESVKMLRPVVARDNVFVLFEERTLGRVLSYIREAGFEVKDARPADMPKGIYKRSDTLYIVKYTTADGRACYKSMNTLEGAMAFQANPTEPVEEEVSSLTLETAAVKASDDEGEEAPIPGNDGDAFAATPCGGVGANTPPHLVQTTAKRDVAEPAQQTTLKQFFSNMKRKSAEKP